MRTASLGLYALMRNGVGEVAEARRLGARALEMARRLGEPETLAAALFYVCIVYPSAEYPEENARFVAELDALCTEDTSLGMSILGFRPWVATFVLSAPGLVRLGRGADLEAHSAASRQRLGESRDAPENVMFHSIAAYVRARRGDTDAALEHGRQALEWASGLQNLVMQANASYARGAALLVAGRCDEAVALIERTIELGYDVARPSAATTWLSNLANAHLKRGDAGAAIAVAERGIALSRQVGYRRAEATNALWLARAQIAAGDLASAEIGIDRVAEQATALEARDLLPVVEEARAALARSRDDAAGCERALRAAARLHRKNGEEWLAVQVEAGIDS
jgi:tetratricopeptide (TPR) repeat protein